MALAIAHFTNGNGKSSIHVKEKIFTDSKIAKNAEDVANHWTANKVVDLLNSIINADILLNIARAMASITNAYGIFNLEKIE